MNPEDLGIAPFAESPIPPEPRTRTGNERTHSRDPLRAVESAVATLVAESDRANGEHVALIETTRVLLAQHAAAVQLAESARAEARRAWGVAIVAGTLLALALLR